MREVLRRHGLPQPDFRSYETREDPLPEGTGLGFPVVLKPVELSGSQGVIRADDPDGFAAAWARIRTILAAEEKASPVLVEGFVPGPEVAVEGILSDGRLQVLAFFDKPDPLDGPFFAETIYVTPSRLTDAQQDAVTRCTQAACSALGLVHGPIHAELRAVTGEPQVIEIAARSIGGLCSRALRFGVGRSLEDLILQHALGTPIRDLRREECAAGVYMIPVPRPGVFREVSGLEAARAEDGIEEISLTVHRGQEVAPLPESAFYLGFIFARAATPARVEDSLRRAVASLSFEIDPH